MRLYRRNHCPATPEDRLRDRGPARRRQAVGGRRRARRRAQGPARAGWSSAATCVASRANCACSTRTARPASACCWSASASRAALAASSIARHCVSALGALARTGARDAVSYLGEAIAEPRCVLRRAPRGRGPRRSAVSRPGHPQLAQAGRAGPEVVRHRGHRGRAEGGGAARPGPRPGDCRGHCAHPRPRQPAGQRLHAGIPGAAGEGTGARAQVREGPGARRARAAGA